MVPSACRASMGPRAGPGGQPTWPQPPGSWESLGPGPTETGSKGGDSPQPGTGPGDGHSTDGPEALVPAAPSAVPPTFALGRCMNWGSEKLPGTPVKVRRTPYSLAPSHLEGGVSGRRRSRSRGRTRDTVSVRATGTGHWGSGWWWPGPSGAPLQACPAPTPADQVRQDTGGFGHARPAKLGHGART